MRRREAFGWGLVGALSFLVLIQGYELVVGVGVGWGVKGLVAGVVASLTAGLAPHVERRLPDNGSP